MGSAVFRSIDFELPHPLPASSVASDVGGAGLRAVAFKVDETPDESVRWILSAGHLDFSLLVAVDVGSRFHQVAIGDGSGQPVGRISEA